MSLFLLCNNPELKVDNHLLPRVVLFVRVFLPPDMILLLIGRLLARCITGSETYSVRRNESDNNFPYSFHGDVRPSPHASWITASVCDLRRPVGA